MPLFVVDAIQMFRTRYVIECKEAEHAGDTVTMSEAEQFSQMDLGERILTTKEITYEEFHRMNKAMMDGGYGDGTHYQAESGSPWMGEKMIHVVNYDAVTEVKGQG
jgi:hypothetical protein